MKELGSDPKDFILAGNSITTVRNETTGNRYTYKITKSKNALTPLTWWVSVLNGTDNSKDYRFMGFIKDGSFTHSLKGGVGKEATSVKGFAWVWNKLVTNSVPEHFKFYHEGRCGRCGRKLTVPESIESGYGPECVKLGAR
jgi:hypothetical protein